MIKTFYTCLLSLLMLLGLSACGALKVGPASQIPLSSAGLEMDLNQLQANQNEYSIHYSLNSQSPPAVLFIPKKSEYTLTLVDQGINKWYEADSQELVTQVIRRIRDNRFGGSRFPSIQAIVTPVAGDGSRERALLAYIYTRGYASLSEVEGKTNTFALRPVPPQRNLKFNNLESGFGGNGAK